MVKVKDMYKRSSQLKRISVSKFLPNPYTFIKNRAGKITDRAPKLSSRGTKKRVPRISFAL